MEQRFSLAYLPRFRKIKPVMGEDRGAAFVRPLKAVRPAGINTDQSDLSDAFR